MRTKDSPVNVLLRYGLEMTNPAPRGQIRFVWALALSFMLTFSFFLIKGCLQQAYGGKEEIQQKPMCHSMSLDLGPMQANRTAIDLEDLDANAFPDVSWGGQYTPSNCIAEDRVAIIVPYRDRQQQLPIFLNHMHQFLMKQQIEYGIYIIEQAGYDYFNRGKLLNVGFVESQLQTLGSWQCFIFHDIDLLPLDQRNLYYCPHPQQPRHLAASIEDRFRPPLGFDGVSAITLKQFTDVNGFTNALWGLSGENKEMIFRLRSMGYNIARYNMSIAKYAHLEHKDSPKNKHLNYQWFTTVMEARSSMRNDGLSTLNYTLLRLEPHRLYTHVVVHIGRSPNYQQMLKILKKHKLNVINGDVKHYNLPRIKEEFGSMF